MLKRFFTFSLLLFAALQFSTLQAQVINLTQNGNGARAAGMGYAFTGLADDASAISWNTAGLTQLYSMEATVVGRLATGSYDYTIERVSPEVSTNAKFQLNFASFIIPFSVGRFNIVGGIAYRTIYDFNETVNMVVPEWDWDDEYKEIGSVNAITPTIAIQLANSFSVGVAYNYNFGKYQYAENGDLDEYSDSRFSGSSFDVGILFRPSPKFSIGGNLNMPNTITRTYESIDYEDAEIKVPFFWSAGAAFRATDQFTISFDYHARPWSKSDNFSEEADQGTSVDLNSFHVGLEYLIVTQSVVIPLRGGFYTKPLHVWDKDNEQVKDNVYTLGAGVMVGNFIVDAAFEFEPSSYDYSSTLSVEKNTMRTTLGATLHFGE